MEKKENGRTAVIPSPMGVALAHLDFIRPRTRESGKWKRTFSDYHVLLRGRDTDSDRHDRIRMWRRRSCLRGFDAGMRKTNEDEQYEITEIPNPVWAHMGRFRPNIPETPKVDAVYT